MKEASGELNMTVITVAAIAAVAAFFYAFVLPTVKQSINRNTLCANATSTNCQNGSCSCTYYDDKGDPQAITCKDSGAGN